MPISVGVADDSDQTRFRMAAERGAQSVKMVHEWLFKTFGMRCITAECHYRKDGQMVMASYDFNQQLPKNGISVPKFSAFDGDAARALETGYRKYAAHIAKREKGEAREVCRLGFEEHDLELDADGYPVVPLVEASQQLAEFLRQIIRVYMSKHYCESLILEGGMTVYFIRSCEWRVEAESTLEQDYCEHIP